MFLCLNLADARAARFSRSVLVYSTSAAKSRARMTVNIREHSPSPIFESAPQRNRAAPSIWSTSPSAKSNKQAAEHRNGRFQIVDGVAAEAEEGDRRDHQQQDGRDDEAAAPIRPGDRGVRCVAAVHGASWEETPPRPFGAARIARLVAFTYGSSPCGL